MSLVSTYPSVITFNSDNVISEPSDVIKNLQFLLENVETFDAGGGEIGYVHHPLKSKTWKIVIGPLEIDITENLFKSSFSIIVVLTIPLLGPVVIANIVGVLSADGGSANIGYPGILGGTITLKDEENGDVLLSWDFTAFGKSYKGSRVLYQ